MSVLIKGQHMPRDCFDCIAITYIEIGDRSEFYCLAKSREMLRVDDYLQSGKRPPECPLAEVPTPHGRLIDAEALEAAIHEHDYYLKDMFNSTDHGMFTVGIEQIISEAPTVIEADEGKND